MASDGQRHVIGIVGGGPAGLVLAIELGRRNIACTLFEEDAEPPWFPKANSSTARTMEHYRRLGFVDEIRNVGLPLDYPQDVAYFTRYTGGWELARLKGLSRRAALSSEARNDPAWPTPEPVHRANQFFIEPILRRQAARYPSVDLRFGWRVTSVVSRADGIELVAEELASGGSERHSFAYLCGCDGPRSLVREQLGLRYEGITNEQRFFMGGQMLATRLSAPAFYDTVEGGLAWQYWAVNAERRSVISALDGKGELTFHTQLPQGVKKSEEWVAESLRLTVQKPFAYKVLAMAEWTAGFTLVAERMALDRAFLVGDAAHLFTPTGGLGYNTSVDDAANLGWKLAAVAQGWGGPGLLASYENERLPVAKRNTRFSRGLADSLGLTPVTPQHEERSAEGERLRSELAATLATHAHDEFHTPGIQLGVRYDGSPIVLDDNAARPADEPHRYVPACFPGARAPHIWLDGTSCLFDLFGADFTLLGFDRSVDLSPMASCARRRGVPMKTIVLDHAGARDLYGCDLVLVRPDQHIAWRGNRLPDDLDELLGKATGW